MLTGVSGRSALLIHRLPNTVHHHKRRFCLVYAVPAGVTARQAIKSFDLSDSTPSLKQFLLRRPRGRLYFVAL